jgi:hypothetical protein
MRDSDAFFRGQFRRSYIHASIKLHGIGVDYLGA